MHRHRGLRGREVRRHGKRAADRARQVELLVIRSMSAVIRERKRREAAAAAKLYFKTGYSDLDGMFVINEARGTRKPV